MSFVLRKLDRRAAFHPVSWIGKGNVQADALSNLRTSENALSVWLVDDNCANLDRIVAALAAGRMKLDKLDYALIDQQALESLELQITPKKGDSCDDDANTRWHQDVRGLSGTKLLDLAIAMRAHGEFRRVLKSGVAARITASIQKGFIDPNRIEDRLRKDLPVVPDVPI